ncbi:hypothetical protein AMTRI_Chr01g137070 [Amborella trichopoda]
MAFESFGANPGPLGPSRANPFSHSSHENQRDDPIYAPKRSRSPPLPHETDKCFSNHQLPSEEVVSPAPSNGNQLKPSLIDTSPQAQRKSTSPCGHHNDAWYSGTKSPPLAAGFQASKRTRSPSNPHEDGYFMPNSRSTSNEMETKARRLDRFKDELKENIEYSPDFSTPRTIGNKALSNSREKSRPITGTISPLSDPGGMETTFDGEVEPSCVVAGLCPDMCPEPEREERGRKGDLDKYERLNEDRNQTSKFLAVKKYTRTADREAHLIRPMPVLQKTVNYLLNLLNQPYDDQLLGLYNFLWDRMRAIRMDLRMQHIFNRDAILMQEQMIRFHIIAMHELCEYTKGEGFSEGFDAHLNIEQMNKTSVELFQMYDDHRKKGNSVPTEKEFRGYYALLKLDKHPGYKVEPAELSLDLAKMTPEIRNSSEVLFARAVARACRTGNFIAFFRLARKATYLQACLMHAHFAKLRSQALASLHSGLQSNQGIPVAQVVKWLGMEGEDIESLLQYHGFLIKHFEDAYMVKEGPFLNADRDYVTKCSRLVHLKKSAKVVDDVVSDQQVTHMQVEKRTGDVMEKPDKKIGHLIKSKWVDSADEGMHDSDAGIFHKYNQHSSMFKAPLLVNSSPVPINSEFIADTYMVESPQFASDQDGSQLVAMEITKECQLTEDDNLMDQSMGHKYLPEVDEAPEFGTSKVMEIKNTNEEPARSMALMEHVDNEVEMVNQKAEADNARLKLIIRIWKQCSKKRREAREQHQLMSNAALSSLSLGPPIRPNKAETKPVDELNIDYVTKERYYRHEKSWSRLNVSEVVVPVLKERNPDAKCLCWKLILCSQGEIPNGQGLGHRKNASWMVGSWLHAKLLGHGNEDEKNDLLVSSPGLSIWRKWVVNPIDRNHICCLSVVKEVSFDNTGPAKFSEAVAGGSGILFLLSDCNRCDLERARLHKLVMSLPSGSRLPLLIAASTMGEYEVLDPYAMITNRLELGNLDQTRINSFSIIFLDKAQGIDGFFSDANLREGLQWLANLSPQQPILRRLKTHDLVLSYLSSSMEILKKTNFYEVSPDQCINAFNDALEKSVDEIIVASQCSTTGWPCPEVDLLQECSREGRIVNLYLPRIGWNSAEKIEPILVNLKACKLPFFSTRQIWYNEFFKGNFAEIEEKKSVLEKCLKWYLNHGSGIMGEEMAEREAGLMVQRCAYLVRERLTYQIVPRWPVIFRRIFNWRLLNLTNGRSSAIYILEHRFRPILEGDMSIDWAPTELSFDEMLEAGCGILGFLETTNQGNGLIEPARGGEGDWLRFQGHLLQSSEEFRNNEMSLRSEILRSEEILTEDGILTSDVFDENAIENEKRRIVGWEEGDKLNRLLEQCDIVQSKIDEKLAIFF